jgi:hypothetical protein
MTQEKAKPIIPVDVIAMPPLKMVLVHAKNERENNVTLVSSLRQASEAETPKGKQVDPESIMKIIEYLSKRE